VLSRWVGTLFLVLALLQLVPVWAPAYYPTADGPSHLYNAFVLRELLQHHGGPIAETFAIDWRPHPNVLGHWVLVVLLGAFSPVVAEKILVSLIILLFLGGGWMLAGAVDPRGQPYAFLALPFAHHEMLQYGFYNFAISAGLYLVTLAVWWRRRDRPDWRTIALVATLTLLCYASHPASTLLLIGSIGLLWLLALRRHVRHFVAFVPVLPLLGWFSLQQQHAAFGGWAPLARRLGDLAQFRILLTFDRVQLALGTALFAILVALIVATIAIERRRREEDAFLVLFLIVAALFLAAPANAANGMFVPERLAVLLPLLPLPWLTPRLPRAASVALIAVLSIAAIGNSVYLTRHDRAIAGRVTAFVRAERAIPAGTTVLALNGERRPEGTVLPLLAHTSGYVAIERGSADLDNYEADYGYFPIKHRPGTPTINRVEVEEDPENVDADAIASLADYVFVWHLPATAPVIAGLDRHYALQAISPEARIYRHRDADNTFSELLLPIGGTPRPIDGPGERWNVEQTISNRGLLPLPVHLSACMPAPCDFVLAPGQSRRIASEPDRPFIIARLPRLRERDALVKTIVERDGGDGGYSFLAVPSMPLSSFPTRTLDIAGVPLGGRVRLRVWIAGDAPSAFELAAYSEDGRTELKRLSLPRPKDGYFAANVTPIFAPLKGRIHLRIDAGNDAARVWGFVSETGGSADALYLPTSDRIRTP